MDHFHYYPHVLADHLTDMNNAKQTVPSKENRDVAQQQATR
jgi:hypothetical protein